MREILFRGKRVDNGEWVYGWLGHLRSYNPRAKTISTIYFTEITEDYENKLNTIVDYKTIGQYTGLTDKNGTKIFEGDIFKDSLGVISVVEWSKDGRFLGFTLNTQKSCRWDRGRCVVYIDREPSVEVIGNIFDNPELLEGAN